MLVGPSYFPMFRFGIEIFYNNEIEYPLREKIGGAGISPIFYCLSFSILGSLERQE
jgi:hypothetical protein